METQVNKCCLNFVAFILTFLVMISLPLLMALLGFFFIVRQFVGNVLILFRKDLRKILDPASTNFACDDLYIIQVIVTFEGQLTIEEVRDNYFERSLTERVDGGKLRYPEARDCLVDWLGYKFWKTDENFSLKNHVKELPILENSKDESEFANFLQNLCNQKLDLSHSPWEVLISYNKVKDQTNLILRFHHAIGDGLSLLTFLIESAGGQTIHHSVLQNKVKLSLVAKFLRPLGILTLGTFQYMQYVLSRNTKILSLVDKYHGADVREHFAICDTSFSVKDIKSFKDCLGVSFTSVIYGVINSGLRKFLRNEGMACPYTVSALCPFPLPNHPSRFSNYMSLFPLDLVPEDKDGVLGIIRKEHKIYEETKNTSIFPLLIPHIVGLLGILPVRLVKMLNKDGVLPVQISIFPTSSHRHKFFGRAIPPEMCFTVGLPYCVVLGFYVMSYGDVLRIAIQAKSTLFTYAQIQKLAISIETELQNCLSLHV